MKYKLVKGHGVLKIGEMLSDAKLAAIKLDASRLMGNAPVLHSYSTPTGSHPLVWKESSVPHKYVPYLTPPTDPATRRFAEAIMALEGKVYKCFPSYNGINYISKSDADLLPDCP